MGKDTQGHGSGPRSSAVARVDDKYGTQHVPITKSKAKAVGNGYGHVAPGWRAMVHKDLPSAMLKLETHPGFRGWEKKPSEREAPTTSYAAQGGKVTAGKPSVEKK